MATDSQYGSLPDYVAEILEGKDKMIKVQAKRIEMLESEVQRLRLIRETLSTQLAVASYQLQLVHQGQTSSWPVQESTTKIAESFAESPRNEKLSNGHDSKYTLTSSTLGQNNIHDVAKKSSVTCMDNVFTGSSAGEFTLTRRQEQLAKQYGGVIRACRAASKIQQTFRQYTLNRNFARLRQEAENTKFSNGENTCRKLRMKRFGELFKKDDCQDGRGSTVGDLVDIDFATLDEEAETGSLGAPFDSRHSSFEEDGSSREGSPVKDRMIISCSISRENKMEAVRNRTNGPTAGPTMTSIVDPTSYDFENVLEAEGNDESAIVSQTSAEEQLNGLKNLENQLNAADYLGLGKFRLLSLRERCGGSLAANNVNRTDVPVTSFNNIFPLLAKSNEYRSHTNSNFASLGESVSQYFPASLTGGYCSSESPKRQAGDRPDLYQHSTNFNGDASPVWRRKANSSWLNGHGEDGNPLFTGLPFSRASDFSVANDAEFYTSSATGSTTDKTSLGSGSDIISAVVAASTTSFDSDIGASEKEGVNSGPAGLTDRQTKRLYRIGLNLFNRKPEKGIQFLMSYKFIENNPRSVARFLLTRKGLSKQMVGSYLGDLQQQFNMEVLECFTSEIDFTDLQIDIALRRFQSYFRMPGEAQKIERLMEAFATCYHDCNSSSSSGFRTPDIVFLLAYAIVMLNTDLHNSSIKPEKKMRAQDFIKNLRGIDGGGNIDTEVLQGIYDRIWSSPFKPAGDHVVQVAKVDTMIVGKKPILIQPCRRLVCYCRLFEVYDPLKREKLNQHQRDIFLFNDIMMVTKMTNKKKSCLAYTYREHFNLLGMKIVLFDLPHCRYGIQLLSGKDGLVLITFCASSDSELKKFVGDLNEAILEVNEMETLRIQEELSKQSSSDPTLNLMVSNYQQQISIHSFTSALVTAPKTSVAPATQHFNHMQCESNSLLDRHQLGDNRHNQTMLTQTGMTQIYSFPSTTSSFNNSSLNRHSKDSGIVDIDGPMKLFADPDDARIKSLSLQPSPLDREYGKIQQKLVQQSPFGSFVDVHREIGIHRNSSGSLDSGIPMNVHGSTNSVSERSGSLSSHIMQSQLMHKSNTFNPGITSSISSLISSSSSSSSKFNLLSIMNKTCRTDE